MPSYLAVCAGALGLSLACALPAAARPAARHRPPRAVNVELQAFESCQKAHGDDAASESCIERLKAHVRRHPADAFAAAKLVRVHAMHWQALDFFALAIHEKAGKQQCADADLRAAVVSGLALPTHYPAVALAQNLLQGPCRKQLEPEVIAQLQRANPSFRANACALVPEQVRATRCQAKPEDSEPEASLPHEPDKAEMVAAAPALREAPPQRRETTARPAVHRLEDTFPSVPGQASKVSPPAVAALRTLDWRLLDVDADSAELLRGLHGEELLLVRTKSERAAYVLLKFKGVQGPWNGRVLVALERKSAAGKDYVVLQEDQPVIVMTERQRQFQAFPKGSIGGVWLSPLQPGDQAVRLPSRQEIASEIAAASP